MLGIESSCDETAAAVVGGEGVVLSSVIASQIPIHARYGGVVPELASRNHLTAIGPVIERALDEAGRGLEELDGIAVTTGPGLAGCLLVGLQVAKSLAYARGLPVVPVDHIAAHVHAVMLRDERGAGARRPSYPYLALAVSGGHTSLGKVVAPGEVELLGQTLDDAAGEAFDKVAKMMGLPYPGGVEIDRLSAAGRADACAFPRPMLASGLDFSFSGLKTAVRYRLEGDGLIGAAKDSRLEALPDLAASFQEAVADVLVTKAVRACSAEGIGELVLAGGVACNSRLRELARDESERRGLELFLAPARYCTDNAAMVGGLGLTLLERGASLSGREMLGLDIYATRRPSR